MNAKISETLGLVPLHQTKEVIVSEVPEPKPDSDSDREYARESIRNIIDGGASALENILDIASATEDPKAFEAYATVMKNLVAANKALVSLSDQKKEAAPQTVTTTNNNLFTGTTEEIINYVKSRKSE